MQADDDSDLSEEDAAKTDKQSQMKSVTSKQGRHKRKAPIRNCTSFEKQQPRWASDRKQSHDGDVCDIRSLNYELINAHRNTKNGPDLGRFSRRPELFPQQNMPDGLLYNNPDKRPFEQQSTLNLGALKFDKRPGFKSSSKNTTAEQSKEQLDQKATEPKEKESSPPRSLYRDTSKCFVSFEKQTQRGDKLFKFDQNNIKSLTKRMNKKELKFSDTIPNNMRPRRPGSRVDMSQMYFRDTAYRYYDKEGNRE